MLLNLLPCFLLRGTDLLIQCFFYDSLFDQHSDVEVNLV